MAVAWFGAQVRARIEEEALKTEFIRDPANPLENMPNERVKTWFRLEKQSIMDLCAILYSTLKRPTARCKSIPPLYQILVVLRFLASGTYYHVYEGHQWMSK